MNGGQVDLAGTDGVEWDHYHSNGSTRVNRISIRSRDGPSTEENSLDDWTDLENPRCRPSHAGRNAPILLGVRA